MPKWTFENKITVGNLLTLGAMLLGAIIAWNTMVNDLRTNARETAAVAMRVASVEAAQIQASKDAASMLAGINQDKLEIAKLLAELRVDVAYLRRWVEEIKRAERSATNFAE